MAKQKQRRRRKHRGSQSGRVDRTAGRPRSRQQAKAQARARQENKRDLPPTWGGAFRRALLAAAVFFFAIVALFRAPVGGAISVTILMLGFYTFLGYWLEAFMWRRRMRAKSKAREGA
jgi:hypothetical protein